MRRSKCLIIKFLILLTVVGAILKPTTDSVAQRQNDIPSKTFGIVDGYWRPEATRNLGVGWDRIMFDWSRFQPNGPGDFEQDAVRNEWLVYDIENNREVVGMIINTPAWASESGLPTAIPDGLYEPFDSPENNWGVFLHQLALTYAPLGIHRWIIWNKPDIQPNDPAYPHTLDSRIADYYRMVKIADLSISAVDEEAKIYLGGLVWWNDIAMERENFLEQFLEIAVNDPTAPENNYYFDGVSLNITINPNPVNGFNSTTDSVGDITSTVRLMLDEAGLDDKQIWITELNVSPTLDPNGGMPDAAIGISLQQQADFMIQATAIALAAGAERVAVHKLFDSNFEVGIDEPFGLVRFDNTYRPAFAAYQYAIDTFTNTLSAIAGRSQNGRLAILEQENRTVYVMWSADTTPVSFWVEAEFTDDVELTDTFGNTLPEPRIGVGPNEVNVHVIQTEAARIDISGTVLVSGSPKVLILEGGARSVWASTDGFNAVRLH
jgi:hypothetical protein